MKKLLLFSIISTILAFSFQANASHIMGGDITYRCVGNNNFVFRVTVYRDCAGIPFGNQSVVIQNNAGLATITCSLTSVIEVTPVCIPSGNLTALSCNASNPGGQQRFIFESQPIKLDTIPIPGPNGYSFYTTTTGQGNIPCCRNMIQNTTSCANLVLRVEMHAFRSNPSDPTSLVWAGNQCDNSPRFTQNQTSVQVNSFSERLIDNSAQDLDQDSLVYSFGSPAIGLGQFCNFIAPYSIQDPFPYIVQNPDSSRINAQNGQIRFIPTNQGNWQSCVVVKSFRNGQLVSEIFRDFQLMVLNTPVGFNPNNQAPVITSNINSCNQVNAETITLFAGDTLNFSVQAIDTNAGQQVKLYAQSSIFGNANNSLTTGCLNPPCAQMFGFPGTPQEFLPPSAIVERNDTVGYGFTGLNSAGFRIQWATDCSNYSNSNHLGDAARIFTITIIAKDDQCPVNQVAYKVINVRLLPKPKLDQPKIECISVNNQGFVELALSNTFDSTTIYSLDLCKFSNDSIAALNSSISRRLSSFNQHEIFRSSNQNGPYTIAGTINTFLGTNGLTQFIDSNVSANNSPLYYFVRTKSACFPNDYSNLDTLSTIFLNSSYASNSLNLSWNSISDNFVPAPNNPYLLDSAIVRNGNFSFINSFSSAFNQSLNLSLPANNDTLATRVRIENLLASCVSSSNISKVILANGVGVQNNSLKNLNIFPNPSDGNIQIELENKGTTTLNVHNMLGQLVKTVLITQNITNLNLSELPSGAYLITAVGFETKRFVKF